MMKKISSFLAAAVLAPLGALAQSPDQPGKAPAAHAGHAAHAAAQTDQAFSQAAALTDGEVRKIDKDASKLTIRHGEIKHLSMPPMTMVFLVKDNTLLDTVKVGDKIRFMVTHQNGRMVVTDIQPAKAAP